MGKMQCEIGVDSRLNMFAVKDTNRKTVDVQWGRG